MLFDFCKLLNIDTFWNLKSGIWNLENKVIKVLTIKPE